MKKRFRVYFKTNELIILIILVILLVVVIGILLWRAQEALPAVGIFFGAMFLLFLVSEAKCFHFLKITEMQALEKVYKKPIEITPQTFSWISKDFPKQKRAVEEHNEKISENAQ